jgi:hypothetical protein
MELEWASENKNTFTTKKRKRKSASVDNKTRQRTLIMWEGNRNVDHQIYYCFLIFRFNENITIWFLINIILLFHNYIFPMATQRILKRVRLYKICYRKRNVILFRLRSIIIIIVYFHFHLKFTAMILQYEVRIILWTKNYFKIFPK